MKFIRGGVQLIVHYLPSSHRDHFQYGGLMFEITKKNVVHFEMRTIQELNQMINLDISRPLFKSIFEHSIDDKIQRLQISKDDLSPLYNLSIINGIREDSLNRARSQYLINLDREQINEIQSNIRMATILIELNMNSTNYGNVSHLSTTAHSFYKLKAILTPNHIQDERQELIKIKSEWRAMSNNEMFHDYVYLRDACTTKLFVDRAEPSNKRSSVVFSGAFRQSQQQKKLDKIRRFTQIKSISQLADNTPLHRSVSRPALEEVKGLVEQLIQKVLSEQLETLLPLMDMMVMKCRESGIVSFYLISIYLQTQVQYIYCRRREGYQIWKRFLRTCNLQGKMLIKYKLVAYRQLAKVALDLGDHDRSIIYLKKLLKLSWVMKDRENELAAYDMIALHYYYVQDVERAKFFHQKFASGEYEELDSNVRIVGITEYLTTQRMKAQLNDQDSFSIDEMDLDIIIQKDNIKKWQQGLPVFDSRKSSQHRVFINQWSCNRDLTVHLLNREKFKHKGEDVSFIPLNNAIRKLIRLFCFDLKYYLKNGNLFNFT